MMLGVGGVGPIPDAIDDRGGAARRQPALGRLVPVLPADEAAERCESGGAAVSSFFPGAGPRNTLPTTSREIQAIVAEFTKRGAVMKSNNSGVTDGIPTRTERLEFGPPTDPNLIDKLAPLKRVGTAFLADMPQEPQALLRLAIDEPAGCSVMQGTAHHRGLA